MSDPGNDPSAQSNQDTLNDGSGSGRVSFLEQALWRQFTEAKSLQEFAAPWLALQCGFIGGAHRGTVVMGDHQGENFAPVAFWPEEAGQLSGLSSVAEAALAEQQGVVEQDPEQPELSYLAYPTKLNDQVIGVVALELRGPDTDLKLAVRQLQWGVGWLVAMLRRERGQSDQSLKQESATILDLTALILEQDNYREACTALVTELAGRLDCNQVSLGFRKYGRTSVAALSHAGQFGRRMNLIRDIGSAMDEAIDQSAIVTYPRLPEQSARADRAHQNLSRKHETGALLTVPLALRGQLVGALTLERNQEKGFDLSTVSLCDGIATVAAPVLEEMRQNDRWIMVKLFLSLARQLGRLLGPRYLGRKLFAVAIVLISIFFATTRGSFEVTAPAVLEGAVLRSVTSPFDGYIASQAARAGDVVTKGQVLAKLDDKELIFERLKWDTKRLQQKVEHDRAMAERNRAESLAIAAQIDQAKAQIALLDAQLARIVLRAPFDGIVITGDLSQLVGGAVKRGDQLFKVAPLNAYRVILEVEEGDIADVHAKQKGALLLASLPEESFVFKLGQTIPTTETSEGRNFYKVEASLTETSGRLRPGMRGVAKVIVDERLLFHIWTAKLVNWFRLFIWKWSPWHGAKQ